MEQVVQVTGACGQVEGGTTRLALMMQQLPEHEQLALPGVLLAFQSWRI